MHGYAWLLLVLPLLGFAINGALGRRLSRNTVTMVGCGVIGLAFVVGLLAYGQLLSWSPARQVHDGDLSYYRWVTSGVFHLDFGILIDPLSIVMVLVVTGVGFLIHVYSAGYMHDDPNYSRFFAYMNLFIFSMLVLVLANNFLFLLVGWGLVGLSSYLLIGFWYYNTAALLAARKAFIMNVIGDVGMMLAAFTIFRQWGTLQYAEVFSKAQSYKPNDPIITGICLLLLVGAVAKSAQLPLHTWLPDAMEGPTPVSALIHAATMVTAGVYLIARCHVLYELSPYASGVVAIIGACGALFAATIAVVQTDIKRVLAFSTMSQIAYMFLGVGVGAYASGMFHLVTHAFFKALLFMGAGSVIHAMGGEQDIRKMGALRSKLPRTYLFFTVGVVAIAGVPPFSGFWSKDEILAHTWALQDWHWILWVMGFLTAGLTTFYMFRLWYLVFQGRSRIDKKVAAHIHESPQSMMLPMAILAVLSIIGGVIQLPFFPKLSEFMAPVFQLQFPQAPSLHYGDVDFQWGAFVGLLALIAIGFVAARDLYRNGPLPKARGNRVVYEFLLNRWYIDDLYNMLFEKPVYAFAHVSWRWLDRSVIDRAVNGVAALVRVTSEDVQPVESGYVRGYALSLFAGVLLVVILIVAQR